MLATILSMRHSVAQLKESSFPSTGSVVNSIRGMSGAHDRDALDAMTPYFGEPGANQ